MAISPLAAEAQAIAAEFDFGAEDGRRAVRKFVAQMSILHFVVVLKCQAYDVQVLGWPRTGIP